jgi:hypothetical protein
MPADIASAFIGAGATILAATIPLAVKSTMIVILNIYPRGEMLSWIAGKERRKITI